MNNWPGLLACQPKCQPLRVPQKFLMPGREKLIQSATTKFFNRDAGMHLFPIFLRLGTLDFLTDLSSHLSYLYIKRLTVYCFQLIVLIVA